MKKLFTTLFAATIVVASYAQNDTRMHIILTNGTDQTINVADIDSIYFDKPAPQTPSSAYQIALPDDWSTTLVYKVMAGDKQVAEIAREYVRSWDAKTSANAIDEVLTVIYPMGADGKADLSKGLATNGATIAWDVKGDSVATYKPGSAPVSTLYVVDGQIVTTTKAQDITAATLVPYVLEDNRGGDDQNTYGIVKIAAQYWMTGNLKAKTFRDGTPITKCGLNDASQWEANTSGAYHIYDDDEVNNWPYFGAMYNGYAVVSDKGLAPEGWEVTTYDQWQALKTYLRKGQSSKIKSTTQWTSTVGKNTTGLNIYPGGNYAGSITSDNGAGIDVYFWTSNKTKDPLTRPSDALLVTRVKSSLVVSTMQMHNYLFGHYVRCIRK